MNEADNVLKTIRKTALKRGADAEEKVENILEWLAQKGFIYYFYRKNVAGTDFVIAGDFGKIEFGIKSSYAGANNPKIKKLKEKYKNYNELQFIVLPSYRYPEILEKFLTFLSKILKDRFDESTRKKIVENFIEEVA